jgi:hypothetical protein
MKTERILIIVCGALVGAIAVVLVLRGNPRNMGFCIACFQRDIAGALGLHRAAVVQYIRPEIIGIVLGALLASLIFREFRPEGGSAPLLRFFVGMFVMMGALVFLGCPLRMILRLAGGDLNAILALAGFACGIFVGVIFLKTGFDLGRSKRQHQISGWAFPIFMLILLALAITAYKFKPQSEGPIFVSSKGPGSSHAPLFLSLGAGVLVGLLAQRSRLCLMGGTRDLFLAGNTHLLSGFAAILVIAFLGNLLAGKLDFGFSEQPIAHTEHLWNFLGMALVGIGSLIIGGCPLRQLVLAGRGNTDSALAVLGMLIGAACAHNFNMAASPKGVPTWGRIITIAGLAICVLIAALHRQRH